MKKKMALLLLIAGLVSSIFATCVLAARMPVPEPDETTTTTTHSDEKDWNWLLGSEVRDLAVEYVLQEYDVLKGVEAPSSWDARDLTPGLIGQTNMEYTGGGWTVNVSSPVVPNPTHTVEISHSSGFEWQGSVDHNGNI